MSMTAEVEAGILTTKIYIQKYDVLKNHLTSQTLHLDFPLLWKKKTHIPQKSHQETEEIKPKS